MLVHPSQNMLYHDYQAIAPSGLTLYSFYYGPQYNEEPRELCHNLCSQFIANFLRS